MKLALRAAGLRVRGAVVTVAAFALLPAAFAQKTIHIPADYPTIQQGIDAAANGDTVLVSPGTYVENIDFKGKEITVTSGATAFSDAATKSTIIDGGGKGPVATFQTNEGNGAVLNGFTIQNGLGLPSPTGNAPFDTGGGAFVSNASPLISNNVIARNQVSGVGIYGNSAAPQIRGNVIAGNIPNASGTYYGGVNGAGIVITFGAGTEIVGNTIEGNTSNCCPAGIEAGFVDNLLIQNNIIRDNQSPYGPGIAASGTGNISIIQNLIYGNAASGTISIEGAGIILTFTDSSPLATSVLLMINNSIYGNTVANPRVLASAGEQVQIDGAYEQFTIAGNLFVSSNDQEAINCGITSPPYPAFLDNDAFNLVGQAYLSTCVQGGLGNGDLSVDPLFVNAVAGDFHLQGASQAIGTGDVNAPGLPATDLDGNPRVVNGKVDMGVYEYQGAVPSKTATTSVLSASQSAINYGQAVVFTVKAGGAGGTPTGTAQFFDGAAGIGSAALVNGVAMLSTSTLAVGSHIMTAQYPGDSTFAASVSNAVTVVVNGDATTATLTAAPNPDDAYQPFTMTAMVTSSAGTPTGSVNFLSGTGTPVLLGTAALNASGVATATTSTLGAGTYLLMAQYEGAGNYSPATSNLYVEHVVAGDTEVSLTGGPNPAYSGQFVTFTATVSPVKPGGAPAGTITFHDGGALLGGSTVGAGGVASYTTSALAPGTHSITAVYGGSADFNGSVSNTFSETIAQVGTTTTLASSLNPSTVGQSVTFRATVASSVSGTATSGSVNFSDDAGGLGSAILGAGGVATLTTSTLPAGTHPVVASYAGFGASAPSTSQPLLQVVDAIDFTLSVDPTTLTLKTENHGIVAVTATPGPGLAGAIQFGCGSLPTYASCAFSATTLAVGGTDALTTKLTVDTSALPGYGDLQAAMLLPLGCLGGVLLFARRRRRWSAAGILAGMCLGAAAAALASGCLIGCSGKLPGSTPPGTYSVPITASDSKGQAHTVVLTLVVTK